MGKDEGCEDGSKETEASHFRSRYCPNQSSSKGKMGESQSEEGSLS